MREEGPISHRSIVVRLVSVAILFAPPEAAFGGSREFVRRWSPPQTGPTRGDRYGREQLLMFAYSVNAGSTNFPIDQGFRWNPFV